MQILIAAMIVFLVFGVFITVLKIASKLVLGLLLLGIIPFLFFVFGSLFLAVTISLLPYLLLIIGGFFIIALLIKMFRRIVYGRTVPKRIVHK